MDPKKRYVQLLSKPNLSNRRGGIHSLSDVKKNEVKDNDKVEWYTGGESSGTAVEAPNSRKNFLDNLVNNAAQCVNNHISN